ncbi:pyridoxamine 5'-phosphate oxidase family protein [Lacisediminihabitans changchengi]|uniref:Pyridoxamine 5'-phosphate oxidase family protein n=1 Tax=Lacisediminihabitans changchengi TaxID=2787634 RepID=A0A934SRT9_9MICO|nr:pyridoxamine 5'-phosphate oxidase family protein [Lacisediminihabitans changchengi]MBK4346964.1 pyridoxamine 5'-phosphate oxidase family protein [Lacisediminihabitans changchengi]MBK4347913.1 pyridoxamine 5'-phosphate oxidase family protein [Lacisediminihabitans changchengi]
MQTADATQLDAEECWSLLRTTDLGRLALMSDGSPDIVPLNYLVGDGVLYFRSAPGDKLAALGVDPAVAFEADGIYSRQRWSVVIRGTAHRVNSDSEIESSGVMELASYLSGDKWNYIRIQPLSVTGRRFRRSPRREPQAVVSAASIG